MSENLSRVQKKRKVALFSVIIVFLAFMPFIRSFMPLGGYVHEGVEWTGRLLILVCVLGRAWCTLYIGGRKSKDLITRGPYSICRNPLYFFSFIGAFGAGAQSGSVTIALLFAIIALLIFTPVVIKEERALQEIFGEPYRLYLQKTPRFLPSPSLWTDSECTSVRLPLLYRTLGDGLFFFASIPLFEAVEKMQLHFNPAFFFAFP